METIEDLEAERLKLFSKLDELDQFELEGLIDYGEPINNPSEKELELVPRGACKFCKLHCDDCSLRCNNFLIYYDREKLIWDEHKKRFIKNFKYEQKLKEQIIAIDHKLNEIKEYENSRI